MPIRVGGVVADALQQVVDGLRPVEQLHMQRLARALPIRVAGCDQDLPAAGPREVAAQVLCPVGIVEDQQPAVVAVQPASDRVDGGALFRLLPFRQAQGAGQRGVVGGEHGRFLAAQPPDQVEVLRMAVGVLHRRLGLANAAAAGDGLHQARGAAGQQGGAQPGEQVLATDEGGIAWEGDVPDARQPARIAWRLALRRRLWRRLGQVEPRGGDAGQQPLAGRVCVAAGEVDGLQLRRQWLCGAVIDPDRQEPGLMPVVARQRFQLGCREPGAAGALGEHRKGQVGILHCSAQPVEHVGSGLA